MAESKKPTQAIQWVRIVVEGIVIVVSILLALAADAWWEEVQRSQAEVAVLQQLADEFQINSERLEADKTWQQESQAAAQVLLGLWGTPQSDSLPQDSLLTLLDHFILPTTYEPVGGALGALIASGDLGIISNDSLRIALAAWPGQLEGLAKYEEAQRRDVDERIIPYLNEHIAWRVLMGLSSDEQGWDHGGGVPFSGAAAVFRQRFFENLVEVRRWRLAIILDGLEGAESRLTLIRGLIDQELGR